jgi:excisionase family DNA binding protein
LIAGTDLLTLEEAAEVLRIAPSTAREWARRGKLPNFRPPGCRRPLVPLRDLEAFVAGVPLEMKKLADGGRIVRPKRSSGRQV